MKKLLRHIGVVSFLFGTFHRPIDFISLGLFLRVTRWKDYDIVKSKIEYIQCKLPSEDYLSGFWRGESRKWVGLESEHVIYNKKITEFPDCVVRYKYTLKYYYKGHFYNYTTINKVPNMFELMKNNNDANILFRIPLYSCHLLDDNGTRNVSKTLTKYLGPRGDCHGLNLTPIDIFGEGDYIVVLKSILGTTVIKNYESIPQF